MNRLRAFVLACVLGGLATACGSSPTAPTLVPLAGNWSGSVTDSFGGIGAVAFTFAQSGSTLTGTWSTSYADPSFNNGGSLTGTASGSSVTVVLSPSVPIYCPYNVVGTRSGNALSGTYAAFNCSVSASGTFSATKK